MWWRRVCSSVNGRVVFEGQPAVPEVLAVHAFPEVPELPELPGVLEVRLLQLLCSWGS